MPIVPQIPSPPLPSSHADPTPALLQSIGGRTFALAAAVVVGAMALGAAGVTLPPWAVELIEVALATVGGSTAVKKAAGAWASSRGPVGVYAPAADHGADTAPDDDDPIVMHVRDAAREVAP